MNEVIGIIIAAILCWLNFVIVDTYFGLPEQPGVKGRNSLLVEFCNCGYIFRTSRAAWR